MSWLIDLFKEIPLSAVLKEKLATADERIKALESEASTLRQENSDLQVRVAELETQKAEIERSYQELRDDKYKTKELPHIERLDEPQLAIMRIIADPGWVENILELEEYLSASGLTLKIIELQYHLDRLLKRGFLRASSGIGDPTSYFLTEIGRAYLVENKLV